MKCRFIHLFSSVVLVLCLLSCADSDPINNPPRQTIPPTDYSFVHFDPAAGDPAQIPLPNDILRNPATGQIAISPTGSPSVDGLVAQLNTLSGFSTSGFMRIPFAGLIDHNSVSNQTLLVVDLAELAAAQQGVAVNPVKEMTFRIEDGADGTVVYPTPVTPLSPGHPHVVIVTQGVIGLPSGLPVESEAVTILLKGTTPFLDENGNSTRSALDNASAAALEPLRQAYQGIWGAAEAITSQDRLYIPFAFAFTTQPLFDTLPVMRERVLATDVNATVQTAVVGTTQVDSLFRFLGIADIPHDAIGAGVIGTFNSPNYISEPLNGPFQGSGADLVEVSTGAVPFIAALPLGDGPFPTVIFQHGITRSKEDILALANIYNSRGLAIIAMDLVLHGDRTGGLDLQNNDTGEPGPDGIPEPSGAYFINLQNLLMSRDNIRQSVGDLYAMTHMITSGHTDFNNDGQPDLLPIGVSYAGSSLGSVVGVPFVTTEPNVAVGIMNVPGARVPTFLNESPTFGPAIRGGLAAAGIVSGTPLFDLYFLVANTILDDADAFNYAAHTFSGALAGGASTNILIQESIGDTVIPNSGTRDLAIAMGIDQVDAVEAVDRLHQVGAPHAGSGMFQYPSDSDQTGGGGHGAFLDPASGPTVAIQTQALTFIATGLQGGTVVINPFTAVKMDLDAAYDAINGPVDVSNMIFFPKQ